MSRSPVAVLGTGMTDLSRRDLTPDGMAHQAVAEALGDAGVSASDLSLVISSNATGGRLNDQGASGANRGSARPASPAYRWSTWTTPVPGAPRRSTSA